jgi:predicted ATP-binding protein involved in virulence
MASFEPNEVIDISDDENEEDVREADPVRREALLEAPRRAQWEIDMEEAMEKSMEDLEKQQAEQEEFERQCMASFREEQERKEKQVAPILQSLQRLATLDSKTKSLYEMLEPILFSYKEGLITTVSLDNETLALIFLSLKSIRLREEDRLFLSMLLEQN